MKILICADQGTAGSHVLTKEHVKKIKGVAKRIEVVVASDAREAQRQAGDADVVVASPRNVPELANAKKLKWLHSLSAGVDRILTPQIMRSPVIVSNSSGVHKTPIAEHVIAFMLIFNRGFLCSLKNQEKRVWKKDDTLTELFGKTVLVVGMGNIGGEVARLAHCFGAHVIGVTKSTREKVTWVDAMKTPSQLEAILPQADFVVSCLPHTKDTHHLFNAKKFKLMKPSAVFINIGRGGLVHEKDLITVLKKKIIAGAGLDVTEIEPLPASSPLWRMPNVIITPHQSGTSEQYMNRAIDRFCLNLKAFLAGMGLPNLVDKKLGY